MKIADLSGTVEARSVTGDVVLDRGTSQKVYASSVSGNVRVSELQPQQIEARTTSGSIVFAGQRSHLKHVRDDTLPKLRPRVQRHSYES